MKHELSRDNAVRTPRNRPVVDELWELLKSRPDVEAALLESIRKAALADVASLAQYFDFLNEMVTMIPTDRDLNRFVSKFYYLIGLSPKGLLGADPSFQQWSRRFAEDWGAFLDTPASAAGISSFFADPSYHIEDYCAAPSGWLTFNQFFARQVRPGKRPIDGLRDDGIVVSPADSVYQGQWPILGDSKITAKGLTWSVLELLDGSPYQDRFRDGVFTHSFLDVNDYHRYHVPVGGVVKEVRKIPGRVMMDVIKKPDGAFDAVDGTGYQFTQDRGLIVIDSPLGLVAVLPIGMAQVSSVNLTAEAGAVLTKGEEFGFFAFGGSDIVMLFEAGKVRLDAEVGTHYKQGKQIGHGDRQISPQFAESIPNEEKRRSMD
jgi:phosphatidylserine decarboxylase